MIYFKKNLKPRLLANADLIPHMRIPWLLKQGIEAYAHRKICSTKSSRSGTTLKLTTKAFVFSLQHLTTRSSFPSKNRLHLKQFAGSMASMFFPNTTYQQDFSVKFSWDIDKSPCLSNKVNAVVSMSSAISDKQAESLLKETLSAKASVKDDQQWTVLSDGVKLMGVRYSMGVVGSDYQFQRLVLVQALGLAYAEVFNEMMTRCKSAVQNRDHSSLLNIHEEALMFLAAHVYAHPIKRSAEVMYQTWEHVRKQLNLAALEKTALSSGNGLGNCRAHELMQHNREPFNKKNHFGLLPRGNKKSLLIELQ